VATEGSVDQNKDKRWVAQYTDARGKVRYIYRNPSQRQSQHYEMPCGYCSPRSE
jgi:hypothetical protein